MSLVYHGFRNKRHVILIGLTREDIDHIIGGDVASIEDRTGLSNVDFAVFGGETQEDLEANLKEMTDGSA